MTPPPRCEDKVLDTDDVSKPPACPPSAPPLVASASVDSDQFSENALSAEISPVSKYEWHLELAAIIFFLIGSVLYLVCAVRDYHWSQELLELPEWLRFADDDAAWMTYRLEEYGNYSSYSSQGVVERTGGVRRMLMREQLRREREETAYYSKHFRYTQHDAHGPQYTRNSQLQTPGELYYDLYWASLPPEIQDAYTTLGYNETAWDQGQDVESDSLTWDELTPEMQEAALFLGYTEWVWPKFEEPLALEKGSPTKRPINVPSRRPVASLTISLTKAPTATSSESSSLEHTSSSRPNITGVLVGTHGSTRPRPSVSPTKGPTAGPSNSPTAPPSPSPSGPPSFSPTATPSLNLSLAPTPTEALILSNNTMKKTYEHYEKEWWRDLPPEIQDAYTVLGWDETVWDEDDENSYPPSKFMTWVELSPDMKDAAGFIGYTQRTWDVDYLLSSDAASLSNSTDSNATMDSNYYAYYAWNELPPNVMEAAVTLGWDQTLWDNSGTAWSDSKSWSELPPEAQEAAAVFGYDEASWNAGGNPELEALLRETGGEYISNDDDYLFQVAFSDIWVSEYQVLYFFAALCFVFTGILDLAVEKAPLHVLMILAGSFGVASAVFVEDVRLSNILSAVSVHLFVFEGVGLLSKVRDRELLEEGKWTKRLMIFASSEFLLGAIIDVMLSYFYLFDDTANWDTGLMIIWVFSAVLWVHCSLVYMVVFVLDTIQR
ncbi:hypothetical protein ACHAWX_001682 [Stephanocyclus meneghinianus]